MAYGARKQEGPATLADLEALPEGVVGEIIDGTLYVHPRPRAGHTLIAGLGLGGAWAWRLIQKEWRTVSADRASWRPVPAEITSSRTWQVPDTDFRQGALTFRFVLDGTEHEGTRFSPGGTRAEEAERFQAGQRVTAYVPQGQPEQAVLYRSTGDSRFFFVLNMLLPVALLSFCLLFSLSALAGAFGWDLPPEERSRS
ncbi:MAG TPA: DUF3592 domain-containing protein [Myxococcus sp.]|jgi:hypothetical protein|nr:DUF3592 domain-containing protein [Myxococcus sp.]